MNKNKEAKFAVVSLNGLKNRAFWISGTPGDELWAFQYDIWLQKTGTSCLKVKTGLIVFFTMKGIMYCIHLPMVQTLM